MWRSSRKLTRKLTRKLVKAKDGFMILPSIPPGFVGIPAQLPERAELPAAGGTVKINMAQQF